MKKILFLLLVTTASYSQALFDKGVKVTGGITTDNTATKVVVQSANNVLNTIAKNDLIDVVIVNTTAELTSGIGNIAKLYATRDNTIIYRYNGTIYVALGGDISAKEDIANKQNSLAVDVTNLKYPTVTAVRTHTTDTNNPHAVTKAQVGLANVDNTSDVNKVISTATQTALNLKANLASPTFTGVPLAPTATVGTNTTQIATTAFVTTADSGNVKLTGDQGISGQKTFSNPTGSAIVSVNNSTGFGIFSQNSSTGSGIVSSQSATGTGFNYVGANNGTNTFTVNKLGATTATSFIKSSAPSTNILLAGGGDIAQSSFIGGSGTTNFLTKFTASGTVGNSIVFDNGTNIGIGTNNPVSAKLQLTSTSTTLATAYIYNSNSVAGTSKGIYVEGGTNSSDYSAVFAKANGSVIMLLKGDSNVEINSLSGTAQRIVTANASGQLSATTIPVFADNTAAIAGGLGVGALYRTVIGLLAVVF